MPRWVDDADDREDDDDIDADEPDAAEESGEPRVLCPYCHRQIHEDSPRCPHCGNYLSEEDAPPTRKPWWIILGVLVCLYLVYRWIAG